MPSPATTLAGQEKPPSPKRINNPRRLLILTTSHQSNRTIPMFLHSLTGVKVTPPISSSSTSTAPSTDNQSFAGYTTHAPFQITNKYYSAEVPIWVDEIPISFSPEAPGALAEERIETRAQWKTSFLSDEAREVRDAIGAIVLCVRNPSLMIGKAVPREAYDLASAENGNANGGEDARLQAVIEEDRKDAADREDVHIIKDLAGIVSELKRKIERERNGEDEEGLGGEEMQGTSEVPGLLVLIDENPSAVKKKQISESEDDDTLGPREPFTSPWWEDILYEQGTFGMEVIQWTPSSPTTNTDVPEMRNIYGELEGLPRIKEVLSTHEWTASASDGFSDDADSDDDIMSFLNSGTRGFRDEVDQLEREMMGLRFAINESHDNDEEKEEEENEDTELEVENLEALMMRMRAIKDMSSDLPESKRKEFAAKAVKDILREL
ncbi:conserved hypothetical protein [Talaromyces stipitatus ATCC 10500]|uniref:Alpha and gamma adaptin binding protein p34 n=1 Tax=Talaromyces stipitatus (strain ATCC 10500 / CBS 375.48 / QM 6759 / NRRL 1006) TaxID=441959 RepID=B8ML87_TALSN|nr:uncharacterized protein TSTA_044680 [Talaromyces stipitatus ATCC 10500]EED15002.1 conserved hypothetical protein [Talaromyces stipitatus ATCC 10500]